MKTWLLAAAALGPLILQMPAVAQDADEENSLVQEKIVVTALKRDQSLIEVPAAITVLGGEELQERGIENIQDLSFAVPGLTLREDGPGSYQIFLRGLSNQYGNGALVGVYLDEIPLSLSSIDQLVQPSLDLSQVEVLKGPQGTLYGQGAVAGVVRYVANKPDTNEFGASLQAQLSSVDDGDIGTQGEFMLNLPIAKDLFAVRVAGIIERDGGWQDQPEAGIENGNGNDVEHFRVKALWTPTENLAIEGTYINHNAETQLGLGYEQPDRTVVVAIDPAKQLIPKDFEYQIYSLNVNYDFGFAELVSATTQIDHDHDYPFSYVGGPQTVWGGNLEGNDARFQKSEQFSQELRLSSAEDGAFQWTIGAFYRDAETTLLANDIDTLFFGTVFPDDVFTNDGQSESYAVFADLAYDLTDRLTIGVGGRYFEDNQTSIENDGDETFDSFDPRAYLSFELNDNTNLYASYGSGFRSGGFNSRGLPAYDAESLQSYEIGIKGTGLDGALNYEVAAFHSEYEDMLRRGLIFVEATADFLELTSNIGEAEVTGIEFGASIKPTNQITLYANGAYTDTEITGVDGTDATNLPGDIIDYVPELAFTLGGIYDFQVTENIDGFIRADFSHRDKVPYTDRTSFPAENVPQYSDALDLLNARLWFAYENKSIEFFATNLTNENVYIDPYAAWTNANRTRPRTIGVKFRIDWQ